MTWARDEFEAVHPRKCASREVLEFVVCSECGASMVHCQVLCAAGVFPLHCPVCLRLVERRPATGIQYPGRLMPWSRFDGDALLSPPRHATRDPLPEAVCELMREKILAALDTCDGNKTAAAALLGITRRRLHYQMSRLGLSATARLH